jgi:hypothetical protein
LTPNFIKKCQRGVGRPKILLPLSQFNRRTRSLRQSLTIILVKIYKLYVYKIIPLDSYSQKVSDDINI